MGNLSKSQQLRELLDSGRISEVLPYLSPEQRQELDDLLIELDVVTWLEHHFIIPEPRDPVTGELLADEGPIKIAPYQAKVLREALKKNPDGTFKYATILWSETKKAGKTTIAAGVLTWLAWTTQNAECYCVANDGKQSKDKIYAKIRKAVMLSRKRKGILGKAHDTRDRVTFPHGSFIEAIACDPSGEAGGEPTMTVFSEIHGMRQEHKRRLWCYDDQTEILTKRGWVYGIDLTVDDIVATITPKTHILEWESPKSILKKHYTGKMHLYESRTFSECVTPNHRLYGMFGRREKHGDLHHEGFMESSKLREYGGYNVYYPLTTPKEYTHEQQPSLVKTRGTYKKPPFEIERGDWCEYLGWYLSEGHIRHNSYRDRKYPTSVLITQDKNAHPNEWQQLKDFHDRVFVNWKLRDHDTSFRVYSIPLAEKIKAECGAGTRNKRVPEYIKNSAPDDLRRFFDAYVDGDGYIQSNGSIQIAIGNKQLADGLSEVALKLGYCVSMKRMVPKGNKNWHPYWRLHLSLCRDGHRHELSKYNDHWKTIDYDSTIWCPSTKNGLIVVQRNGKIYVSGNSEMTIPPTRWGRAIRWAESYAGYKGEGSVLEDLYEKHIENGVRHPDFPDLPVYAQGKTLALWNTIGRQVWHTPEYLAHQAQDLPDNEFRRLHKNEWVSPITDFIPAAWWNACQGNVPPIGDIPIIVAADAAVSGDCFAIVAVSRHPDESKADECIAVRYCQIWKPPPGGKIDFLGTEDDPGPELVIERLIDDYNVTQLCYDSYQLHDMATRLRRKGLVWIKEFGQVRERLESDNQLRQLILHRRILHDGNSPDLAKHISNAAAKIDSEEGRLRIVKQSDRLHIDAAVALSMAAYRCLKLNL